MKLPVRAPARVRIAGARPAAGMSSLEDGGGVRPATFIGAWRVATSEQIAHAPRLLVLSDDPAIARWRLYEEGMQSRRRRTRPLEERPAGPPAPRARFRAETSQCQRVADARGGGIGSNAGPNAGLR